MAYLNTNGAETSVTFAISLLGVVAYAAWQAYVSHRPPERRLGVSGHSGCVAPAGGSVSARRAAELVIEYGVLSSSPRSTLKSVRRRLFTIYVSPRVPPAVRPVIHGRPHRIVRSGMAVVGSASFCPDPFWVYLVRIGAAALSSDHLVLAEAFRRYDFWWRRDRRGQLACRAAFLAFAFTEAS